MFYSLLSSSRRRCDPTMDAMAGRSSFARAGTPIPSEVYYYATRRTMRPSRERRAGAGPGHAGFGRVRGAFLERRWRICGRSWRSLRTKFLPPSKRARWIGTRRVSSRSAPGLSIQRDQPSLLSARLQTEGRLVPFSYFFFFVFAPYFFLACFSQAVFFFLLLSFLHCLRAFASS